MLTENDLKHWSPHPAMLQKVAGLIADGARVLEIGPGHIPFARATDFVDWHAGENRVTCDLNRDRLPFEDKAFDFVYCRHVVEDLYNPFLACDEMSRVARAGYIETPSPLAEMCRGIDGGSPAWRGYHHHRYVVWVEDGTLCLAPKYPIVEHASFGEEGTLSDTLRQDPRTWNSYYLWQDRVRWRLYQHDVDFTIGEPYRRLLQKAIVSGLNNATTILDT